MSCYCSAVNIQNNQTHVSDPKYVFDEETL